MEGGGSLNSHTPGPWIIGTSYTDEIAIRDKDDDECIGVVCELDEGKAKANARLIAASPDLLAFVELVAAGNTEIEDLEREARAIIAQANGGAS